MKPRRKRRYVPVPPAWKVTRPAEHWLDRHEREMEARDARLALLLRNSDHEGRTTNGDKRSSS